MTPSPDHGPYPFSSRLELAATVHPLLELHQRLVREGRPILDLTASNPTRAGFEYPAEAIRAALASPEVLDYDPSAAGAEMTRLAIAADSAERGVEIDPARLLLTSGTSEAYSLLFKILANPGDVILAPRPGYPLIECLARLDGLQTRYYNLREMATDPDSGAVDELVWRLDRRDDWMDEIADRARVAAVVVVSPSNPCGNYLKVEEAAWLGDWCVRRRAALIVDEVFADYPSPGFRPIDPIGAAVEAGALVCRLNGLSKKAGLPQVKLGWVALHGPGPIVEAAWFRLEHAADAYLSASASAQLAAPSLLAMAPDLRAQIQTRCAANALFLDQWLANRPGIDRYVREGGWYGLIRLFDGRSDEDRALLWLERHGVFVHPGYFFDFLRPGYAVFSLLPPEPVFREAIQRLFPKG